MRTAWLFAGQGSDYPGMGVALREKLPCVRTHLELASEATGKDVPRLLEERAPSLMRTEILQPTLVALQLGICAALGARGVRPVVVAGHSLGELGAWAAAGGIGPRDAVFAAAVRGRAMACAAAAHPGAMLAVQAESETELNELIAAGREVGRVALAAHNAPRQWILSGDSDALRAISRCAWASRLPVEGPWQSPVMEGASHAFGAFLESLEPRPLKVPMISTATGDTASSEQIPSLLTRQLVRPIYWTRVMETLQQLDVDGYVVVGPGKGHRQLIRLNAGRRARVFWTHEPAAFDATLEVMRRRRA